MLIEDPGVTLTFARSTRPPAPPPPPMSKPPPPPPPTMSTALIVEMPAGTVHVQIPVVVNERTVAAPSVVVVGEQGAADAGAASGNWLPTMAVLAMAVPAKILRRRARPETGELSIDRDMEKCYESADISAAWHASTMTSTLSLMVPSTTGSRDPTPSCLELWPDLSLSGNQLSSRFLDFSSRTWERPCCRRTRRCSDWASRPRSRCSPRGTGQSLIHGRCPDATAGSGSMTHQHSRRRS